jgi:DNA-binding GntR family transcriptional regulator
MAYSLSHIDASLPEPWLVESLQLDQNEPVIIIEDEGYNYDHEIVVHSYVYYKRGVLDLKFLRKSWQN